MTDTIYRLETNIDDCSGELLGHVMDLLLEAGALDVFFIPIYMKKNRPATLITVLCREDAIGVMEEILFRETTTIGIRSQAMERSILERSRDNVSLSCGEIAVKKVVLPDGSIRLYPEYDSAAALAAKTKIPLPDIIADYYRNAGNKEKDK